MRAKVVAINYSKIVNSLHFCYCLCLYKQDVYINLKRDYKSFVKIQTKAVKL